MSDPIKELRVRMYKSMRAEVRRVARLDNLTPSQWIRKAIMAALAARQDDMTHWPKLTEVEKEDRYGKNT